MHGISVIKISNQKEVNTITITPDGPRGTSAPTHCRQGLGQPCAPQCVFSTVPCRQWLLAECAVVTRHYRALSLKEKQLRSNLTT